MMIENTNIRRPHAAPDNLRLKLFSNSRHALHVGRSLSCWM